jgi:hypothetical protein
MASEYKLPYKAREVARRLDAVVTLEELVGEKSVTDQITDAVAAIPNSHYMVNISESTDDEGVVTYIADKSFSEVETELQNQRAIVAVFGDMFLQLVEYKQHTKMVFSAVSDSWGGTFHWDAATSVITYAAGSMGNGATATDDDILDFLAANDFADVTTDSNGDIITNKNGEIFIL